MVHLSPETFDFFASRVYDTSTMSSIEDFEEDIKRFQYLKRLFNRYMEKGDLKTRLILNHIIVLYNGFGPKATEMMFYRLEGYEKYLKPFLVFLKRMPERIELNGEYVYSNTIPMDENIIRELRKI